MNVPCCQGAQWRRFHEEEWGKQSHAITRRSTRAPRASPRGPRRTSSCKSGAVAAFAACDRTGAAFPPPQTQNDTVHRVQRRPEQHRHDAEHGCGARAAMTMCGAVHKRFFILFDRSTSSAEPPASHRSDYGRNDAVSLVRASTCIKNKGSQAANTIA